jgi:hypothetical protein
MSCPDLAAPRAALNFYHSSSKELREPMTALEAWNRIMERPLPGLSLAFQIRDAISTRFGVKRIGGFTGRCVSHPQVGEKLDFFLIERIAPDVLTLSERDKHLDVVTCIITTNQRLTITSSVKVHNLFGRLYMILVAPAHRLIVWAMLRRLL